MSEKDKLKKYHQQQQQQQIYDSSFDYTLPRPPVVGEERANYVTEWIPQSAHLSPTTTTSMDRITTKYQQKPSSPIPRYDEDVYRMAPRSSPQHHHHHHHHHHHDKPPPACLTWANSLHNLLQDADGVKLFLRYLESEGAQHANSLHFWFACEGLKNHNEIEKIQRLVKLIYKTYFVKSALPISDELRKDVTKNMKSPQCLVPPVTIFDEAQIYIERLINNTTYPNFLKSDIYLQYLQSVQNPNSSSEDFSSESSSSSSSTSNKDLTNLASGIGPLPTLHEGMEFMTKPQTIGYSSGHHTPTLSSGPLRLTKNMLLRSQNYRAQDIRPKSETFAGLFKCRGDGAHAAYNSYNPVSRQDSEMQSLSSHSDVRTDSDNMSLAESYIDTKSSNWSHSGKSNSARYARQLAALNKETDIHQTFIPRTQRIDIKAHQMDFAQHAAILKEKLENVKREQENEELLDRKLKEGDSTCQLDDKNKNELQSRELENAIREKLQFQDDNDQDILDEHVSRVFSDPSLAMSPSLMSPRPLSPHKRRSRRREKDVFSTFSGDSGNVHDFPEMFDTTTTATTTMVKSRSIPEYCDERFVRTSSCRRSSSKKTLAELTDSGVSVVSETPSGNKKIQVLHWLMDSGRGNNNSNNNNNNGSNSGGGSNIGRTANITTCSEMASTSLRDNNRKYRRNYGGGSRSNSLERNSVQDILGPAQPFMADPSMPPPPLPNTSMQLEEARRRLLENDVRVKSRQRFVKYYPDMVASSSSQSTLKKQTKPLQQRPLLNPIDDTTIQTTTTTVVFSFCDEQFPYRTKIPGTQITLRQFKEYLPKKGNYRFFFKTVCEDLDNQVTHEEVSNDNEVLPLWEGKIMAQVKPIFDNL